MIPQPTDGAQLAALRELASTLPFAASVVETLALLPTRSVPVSV